MEHQEEAKLLKDLVNAGEWHLDDFEAYKNAKTTEDVDGKSCSVRFGNFEYTLYGIATKEDLRDMAEFGDNPSDITVQLDGHRPVGSDEEEAAIKAGNMEAYRNLQTRDMHLKVDYDGYENEDYTKRAVWIVFSASDRKNSDAFKQAFTERLLENGEIRFEDIPKYQELKDSHSSFYTARDFVENLNPDARITETEFQGKDYILLEDAYVCGQPSDPYYTALAVPFGVLPNEDNEVPCFQAKFEITDPRVLAGDYTDEGNACDWEYASDMEPDGYIEIPNFMTKKRPSQNIQKDSNTFKQPPETKKEPPYKLYEIGNMYNPDEHPNPEDDWSMVIKADHFPSTDEIKQFCLSDWQKHFGNSDIAIDFVQEISPEEAAEEYDLRNIKSWPVLGEKKDNLAEKQESIKDDVSLEALLRSVCKQKVADGKSPVAINKELKAAVKAVQKELSKANAR